MLTLERNAIAALVLALMAGACVATRQEDPLGTAQFVASNALGSQDYAPGGGAGRLAGGFAGTGPAAPPPAAAGVAPAAAAGSGSVVQPPAAAGTAPSAMAGAPASERPGANAAGTGGTGATGRAGSMAVAGGPASTGAAGAAATTGPAPSAAAGTLTIDFTSVALGGNYAPRNVGAVWVETASGMFVKTLERWAGIRANHLTRWNMASGGWGSIFGGGNSADMMDAVSRATLRSHEKHHVMWNMKDSKGQVVPDGMYNVVIEVADDNRRASGNGNVAFMKGPAPQMVTAPDKAPWTGFSLTYQP